MIPILNTFVAPGLPEPFSLGSGKPLILQTNIALEIEPAKYATIIIKTVTTIKLNGRETLLESFTDITEEDQEAGYIYVLSSKSTDSKIKEINNLYKIGYSTTPVENRIKNAFKRSGLDSEISCIFLINCSEFA